MIKTVNFLYKKNCRNHTSLLLLMSRIDTVCNVNIRELRYCKEKGKQNLCKKSQCKRL